MRRVQQISVVAKLVANREYNIKKNISYTVVLQYFKTYFDFIYFILPLCQKLMQFGKFYLQIFGIVIRCRCINCRFFLNRFPLCFNLFVLLFLVRVCLVVAIQPCMEWNPIKKKIGRSLLRVNPQLLKKNYVHRTKKVNWRLFFDEGQKDRAVTYWSLRYNPKDQWNSAVSDILPQKRASERKIVLAEEDIEFT